MIRVSSIVYNQNCNHYEVAYETAAHFIDESDRYAALKRKIWGKPYLYSNDFQYLTVENLVSFIKKSRRFPYVIAPSSSYEYI